MGGAFDRDRSAPWRRRAVLTGFLACLVLASAAGVATAQEAGAGEDGDEDELLSVSGWAAVATLVLGSAVLLASVETLIHSLVRTAVRFRVSAFLLAVVFSGVEFDNVAFGLFTGFAELQHVAFGLAIGNAVSIFGLVLAVAAIAVPFEVDVPGDYLVLLLVVPLVLLPSMLTGQFGPAYGLLLVAAGVVVFWYVYRSERDADRTFMQSEEVRDAVAVADGETATPWFLPDAVRPLARYDWFWPGLMALSVGGIVVGAELSSTGTSGVMETWNLSGTVLGITLVTLLLTVDDLLLAVEPLRLGYYDVTVGGIIGSLLFFVTANVGLVSLVGTVTVSPATLYFHFPVLLGITGLSAYFLWRGRLTRSRGLLLLGLYVLYLAINVRYLAGVPVPD